MSTRLMVEIHLNTYLFTMKINEVKIGQGVIVVDAPDTQVSEFMARVIGFTDGDVLVKDQEDDVFQVPARCLELDAE